MYKREHYRNNKQRYIDNAASRRRRVLDERVRFLVEFLKNHPCVDCGESDLIVLEFDHTDRQVFRCGLRNPELQLGLRPCGDAKCDVVCANCHRRRTAQRRGYRRRLLSGESE
jgi:hypothetical protein